MKYEVEKDYVYRSSSQVEILRVYQLYSVFTIICAYTQSQEINAGP